MNYLVNEFSFCRLLPARQLLLAPKLVGDRFIDKVVSRKSIVSKGSRRGGVIIFDEVGFLDIHKFNTPEHYYSTHGYTEEKFLITDNNGSLYTYHYDKPDPVECIENVGLYPINSESHWVDGTHSIHFHGTEGIKRHRISGNKYFCLFDWEKREIVWKSKPEENQGFGYAIGAGKLVYQAHQNYGTVYCLDLMTGKNSWQKDPLDILVLTGEQKEYYDRSQKGVVGNPRIFKNLVIVGMPFYSIVALDIETGEKVWEYKLASDEDQYKQTLFNITSTPYRMAVTEKGKVYRLESADVICEYDKHCHELFLIELDATTGKLLQRLEVKAPEGDLQEHIIDQYEKELDFGRETYCDVTNTHYLTCFDGGPIMAINLKTGIVEWNITLPTGSPFGPFFVLNNRLYTSTGYTHYIFEGEGGYISD